MSNFLIRDVLRPATPIHVHFTAVETEAQIYGITRHDDSGSRKGANPQMQFKVTIIFFPLQHKAFASPSKFQSQHPQGVWKGKIGQSRLIYPRSVASLLGKKKSHILYSSKSENPYIQGCCCPSSGHDIAAKDAHTAQEQGRASETNSQR